MTYWSFSGPLLRSIVAAPCMGKTMAGSLDLERSHLSKKIRAALTPPPPWC